MKKVILIALSVLLVSLLAACGTSEEASTGSGSGEKSDKKVLTMGTSADYPPFEYVDSAKGEEIIGFDVDLAKAIGEKLGYEIQVKDMDFNGLIPALETSQVDFVLAGMTPTDERKENVDFSDVYYTASHMIVSKKDSGIESLEDLNGKTLGVQLASIQADKAEEISETVDMTVENRNRIPELVQEIMAGRFDAAMIEDTVAKGYFEKNKDLAGFTIEEDETEAGSAIAFPKGSELTEKFNAELLKMKENGELEKLIVKWFDNK
ncbi:MULTISPECIES: transporter substrate-binding domain-containing protein [unclassified Cytobacillus]|uniref:transporter substrate-binding domain-containing protein n=1 Tax=unclassified Cytobacillus TaxID=2675268 RepID=UPI00135C59DE|nr:transporter substrate-binding domain-containing protein [Cytobacillus sp. AMY 15.2]KAF0818474.1 Arginine-binding extracellular protein ArtP [Bacillus sp. ZZV12-4809]MCM3091550.1 transporter substrate-binding domain-containing protein [Cytobacillus sp. AMY 15.2]